MGCLCCPWLSISALKRRAVVMTRSSKYAPEGPQEIYTERPHSGDPGVPAPRHAPSPGRGARRRSPHSPCLRKPGDTAAEWDRETGPLGSQARTLLKGPAQAWTHLLLAPALGQQLQTRQGPTGETESSDVRTRAEG